MESDSIFHNPYIEKLLSAEIRLWEIPKGGIARVYGMGNLSVGLPGGQEHCRSPIMKRIYVY